MDKGHPYQGSDTKGKIINIISKTSSYIHTEEKTFLRVIHDFEWLIYPDASG